MEVFFKKLFLKVAQNSQENTLCWSLFLCTASNFIKIETPAKVFSC